MSTRTFDLGPDDVIPVAMKRAARQVYLFHLLVGYLPTSRILPTVETADHRQPLCRGRPRDEMHDRFIVAQRLPAPIRGDEREQSMLDFVPFARARRKVAHREGQARLVRELLQFPFPEAQPHPVAAPAVRRDESLARAGIQASPFR